MTNINQMALIMGPSGEGKTASLRNLRNQDRWILANCEAGKEPPFAHKFRMSKITDPRNVLRLFDWAMDPKNAPNVDGMIIDTLTFLMEMFESVVVKTSSNTMVAWGDYNQFFKEIMQDRVPKFGKSVLVLAHSEGKYDEQIMGNKVSVPVKGALKSQGVTAYFSTVVAAKALPITDDLRALQNDLFVITEDEELEGVKHCFQVRKTKQTPGEPIRSPMGLFDIKFPYMDNDAQKLVDHLHAYYGN